ncbi:MAG: PrgI family mobile element protein, partial [Solirubrobacteraceae bacterium]
MSEPNPKTRVRLPADVELEDKLAFGLTARQLLLLGATALLSYTLYTLAASALPLALAATLC